MQPFGTILLSVSYTHLVLLVLAVLAMAKTLFVGLEIDEEYAFSLGFRLVKGDRLFYTCLLYTSSL